MLLGRCAMDGIGALGDESSAVFEGLNGGCVLVHEIDLFQGKTLGLRNAQESKDDTAEASRAPDEEHLRLKACGSRFFVDEIRGSITDTEVPEPIARN